MNSKPHTATAMRQCRPTERAAANAVGAVAYADYVMSLMSGVNQLNERDLVKHHGEGSTPT